jgi:hypothetical protein
LLDGFHHAPAQRERDEKPAKDELHKSLECGG